MRLSVIIFFAAVSLGLAQWIPPAGGTAPSLAALSNSVANKLDLNGGTLSGSVYSSASSASSGPASTELATAGWVRGLFNSGLLFWNTTNVYSPAPAFDTNAMAYSDTTQLTASVRSYSIVSNGQYLGSVMTTNTFTSLPGQVVVNAVLAKTGGNAGYILSVKPEIYFWDGTNLTGDFSASPAIISAGTNKYTWVISFPAQSWTTPVRLVRRFSVSGTTLSGTTPGMNVMVGGGNDSHVSLQQPASSVIDLAPLNAATNALNIGVYGPRIDVYATTAQAIADNVITPILWSGTNYLRGGTFDGTAWVPGVVGMVSIRSVISLDSLPFNGFAIVVLQKNGATYKYGPSTICTVLPSASGAFEFWNSNATNQYKVCLYHGGDSLPKTNIVDANRTWFNGSVFP